MGLTPFCTSLWGVEGTARDGVAKLPGRTGMRQASSSALRAPHTVFLPHARNVRQRARLASCFSPVRIAVPAVSAQVGEAGQCCRENTQTAVGARRRARCGGPLRNQAKLPACFLRGLGEPAETARLPHLAGVSPAKLPAGLPPYSMRERWERQRRTAPAPGHPGEGAVCSCRLFPVPCSLFPAVQLSPGPGTRKIHSQRPFSRRKPTRRSR